MRTIALLICCATLTSLGCRQRPLLAPPGPTSYQQGQAVIHDPYPQNDIGVEEQASRPRDYQKPLAEPVRDRLYRDASPWWQFGG